MPTTRRNFLQGSAAAAILAACSSTKNNVGGEDSAGAGTSPERPDEPEKWLPDEVLDEELFPTGIQICDVSSSSAILSVHCDATSIDLRLMKADGVGWILVEESTAAVENGLAQFPHIKCLIY